MRAKPYIEKFQDNYGRDKWQAVSSDGEIVCGHQHRYEAAAQKCLKDLLDFEPEEVQQWVETVSQTDTVQELVDDRRLVYGEPRETFPRIAQVWSGIAGAHITPEMVPLMMIGHKLVRAAVRPDYSDNSDDIEGYLAIFRELVGPDMVHARSVEEYIKLRRQR